MSGPIFIDISHWNPAPDWAALKAGGVKGVILKATEGTTYVDNTFYSRRLDAIAAGLPTASYHYLHHGSVQEQMGHYLATIKPVPGERVIIDYEDAAVGLDDLWDAVSLLFEAPENLQVTVYSGHLIKEQLGTVYDDLLAKTSLWIAQYTTASEPDWPQATWPVWSLWQYTDKAKVKGISQPVDGNRFNGSSDNAVAWLSPAEPKPAPEPQPEETKVAIEISVSPASAMFSVAVNGEFYVRDDNRQA